MIFNSDLKAENIVNDSTHDWKYFDLRPWSKDYSKRNEEQFFCLNKLKFLLTWRTDWYWVALSAWFYTRWTAADSSDLFTMKMRRYDTSIDQSSYNPLHRKDWAKYFLVYTQYCRLFNQTDVFSDLLCCNDVAKLSPAQSNFNSGKVLRRKILLLANLQR